MTEVGERQRSEIGCRRTERRRTERRRTEGGVNKGAKVKREEANGYAFAIKNVRKIYVFLLIMRSLEVPELGFT